MGWFICHTFSIIVWYNQRYINYNMKEEKDFSLPIYCSTLSNDDLWQSANLLYLCTPRAANYMSCHLLHERRARLHNVYVVRTVSMKTTVILPRVSRADEERYSEWTVVKYNCNLFVVDVYTRRSPIDAVQPRSTELSTYNIEKLKKELL